MELIFSLDEIGEAAGDFISLTKAYTVFAFHGEMGAGKTTFIQAVCKELGVTENISSPTYSIIQQYKYGKDKIIYHIDLYRLKDEEETVQAGVEDCLYSGNKCFIEWPERAFSIFPVDTVKVFLEVIAGGSRKLVVKLPS